MNNNQTDTPARLDTPAEPQKSEPMPDFWQVVTDILDNPFIKPCERDRALFEQGYKVVASGANIITLNYLW